MAYREIIDQSGTTWQVWDVVPGAVEKRAPEITEPPMTTAERRKTRSARVRVSSKMGGGWLAMKCDAERRRIAPIPEGWEEMSEDELRSLVATAKPEGKPRRLIE